LSTGAAATEEVCDVLVDATAAAVDVFRRDDDDADDGDGEDERLDRDDCFVLD
jgi:hypothetical protein